MIAACPECRTQYRVEPQRLSEEGVRLRCTRCQTIFRVRAPQAAAPVPTPAPAPAVRPAPADASAQGASHPSTSGEPTALSERLVLIATPDAENAKRWCEALRGWGLEAESAHDGVEAILKVHRRWPAAVVLDPQLPKMFGFQVCEVMKRNEVLRRIGVVLIGAIHHPQRYRRTPSELYGADAYLEEPDMPEALAPILRDLGLPIGPTQTVAAPSAPEAPAPAPDAPTVPPPVPAEATLPPTPPAEMTLPPTPPAEMTLPPTPPAEMTLPPTPPAEMTLPPRPPVEAARPSTRLAEAARGTPEPVAAVSSPPVEEPRLAPLEVAAPPTVPEPGSMEPAPPPIASPEYDVIDPDTLPQPEAAVLAEPEPTPPPPPAPPSAPEPVAPAAPAPSAASVAPAAPAPSVAPAPVVAPSVDPEVEQAERLARIIISDVVLYNEDKFRAACAAGNVLEALEADLADGRAHFASRVPEHVRNARDFLADELLRVAKSRGLA